METIVMAHAAIPYLINKNSCHSGAVLVRERFRLPKDLARFKAKAWMKEFPSASYWSRLENWESLPDDMISFTMVRLPNVD